MSHPAIDRAVSAAGREIERRALVRTAAAIFGPMTREQMIDAAVRSVDVPAYWREWYQERKPDCECSSCQAHIRMVRAEFNRIAQEQGA